MNRFKSFFSLVVLAGWFACAMHCQADVQSFSRAPQSSSSSFSFPSVPKNHECKSCNVCTWVHSGGIWISSKSISATIPVPEMSSFEQFSILPKSLPAEVSAALQTAAPPELIKSWQFTYRMALLARAPSVVS